MRIRSANILDLPEIVKLLADDELGKQRENYTLPLPKSYVTAFWRIDKDPNHQLIVLENEQREIVGTFQLTFIQHLTYQGRFRAQIEQVRIRSDLRHMGYGQFMMKWAITKARERGAHILQLTSTKVRKDAIRFYEKLGFKSTHEGMKIYF